MSFVAVTALLLMTIGAFVGSGIFNVAAQTSSQVPVLGKLVKAFNDPTQGLIESKDVEWVADDPLDTFRSLNDEISSITYSNNFITLKDTPTVWGSQGQIPAVNSAGSALEWADPTGVQDNSITEGKLAIHNTPIDSYILTWDTTDALEWAPNLTATNATLDGNGTAANPIGVADNAITKDMLSVHNAAQDGWRLEYSSTNGLEWILPTVDTDSTISGSGITGNALSVANNAITEDKLSIHNVRQDDFVLTWGGNRGLEWAESIISTTSNFSGQGTTGSPLTLVSNSINEGQLSIHNSPQTGYYLEWNSLNGMEWVTNPSTGGLITIVSDATLSGTGVTGDVLGVADDSITEIKLDIYNPPQTGYYLEWDTHNGMQWVTNPATGILITVATDTTLTGTGTAGNLLGVADNSLVEGKLSIHNPPQTGYYLEWDTHNGMQWVADPSTGGLSAVTTDSTLSGTGTSLSGDALGVADDSLVEGKLKILNDPVSGYYLEWNTTGTAGMQWVADPASGGLTLVTHDSTLTGQGTSSLPLSVADNSLGEGKLNISNNPTDGYYLRWNTAGMQWVTNPATNALTAVNTDATLTGTGTSGSALRVADNSIEEVKLKVSNTPPGDGYLLTWDGSNLKWGTIITDNSTLSGTGISGSALGVANESLGEGKLNIPISPTNGYYLSWTAGNMKWLADPATNALTAVNTDATLDGDGNTGTVNELRVADDAITEAHLKVSNSPTSTNNILSWGGSDLTWTAVHTNVADESITEPKLDIHNDPPTATDGILTWNNSGDYLNWASSISGSLIVDDTIGEAKLNIQGTRTDGYLLEYDTTDGLTWASRPAQTVTQIEALITSALGSFEAATSQIADGAVTEVKLAQAVKDQLHTDAELAALAPAAYTLGTEPNEFTGTDQESANETRDNFYEGVIEAKQSRADIFSANFQGRVEIELSVGLGAGAAGDSWRLAWGGAGTPLISSNTSNQLITIYWSPTSTLSDILGTVNSYAGLSAEPCWGWPTSRICQFYLQFNYRRY